MTKAISILLSSHIVIQPPGSSVIRWFSHTIDSRDKPSVFGTSIGLVIPSRSKNVTQASQILGFGEHIVITYTLLLKSCNYVPMYDDG